MTLSKWRKWSHEEVIASKDPALCGVGETLTSRYWQGETKAYCHWYSIKALLEALEVAQAGIEERRD